MSARFTPGPWTVEQVNVSESSPMLFVCGPEGANVCALADHEKSVVRPNARLIAAAPKLLEAAEAALQALEGVDALMHKHGMMLGVNCPAISPLRAAILSAKGEEE